MVLVSLLLVLAAAVALVVGLLQSGLAIIYVSIGCSVAAGVLLAVAVVRGKPERVSSGPVPQPAPPTTAPATSRSWEGPQPAVEPERESQREPVVVGATSGVSTAGDETQQLDQAAIELAVRGDEDHGPIPDYDRLRATEVLPLLANLDAGELAQVRAQEAAGRNRFMVLSRIDRELEARGPGEAAGGDAAVGAEAGEGGWDSSDDWDGSKEAGAADADEPAPAVARQPSRSILDNYEQLKVLEILPRLGELDADELAQVRRREQAGQRRAMIINRVDRLIVDARPARQTAPGAPPRRGPARKATAKKAPARKAPAKRVASSKTPAKKAVAQKAPAKKAAAQKAPAKKAPAKKATVVKKATKATKKR